MPIPDAAEAVGGPLVSTVKRASVPPTEELRDAGAVLLDEGRWWRVNEAADAWEPVPGGVPSPDPLGNTQ